DAFLQRALPLRRIMPEDPDVAGAARPVPLQDLGGGRLARPVRSEHREDLTAVDVERDPSDGLQLRVGLAEVAYLDDTFAHPPTLPDAETGPRVHPVAERLAPNEPTEVVEEHVDDRPLPACEVAADVWRDDHGGKRPQRRRDWERLLLVDVERRAADGASLQRVDERSLVHRHPATDVQEARRRLHRSEGSRIEEVVRSR